AFNILKTRIQARADEDDTSLVFPSPRTGKPRNLKSVTRQYKKYFIDAKLPEELHFHSLRHTFASWLASGGTPIATIQQWMGHASIEQTMVYATLLPSALEWKGSSYHAAALQTQQPKHKPLTTTEDEQPSIN